MHHWVSMCETSLLRVHPHTQIKRKTVVKKWKKKQGRVENSEYTWFFIKQARQICSERLLPPLSAFDSLVSKFCSTTENYIDAQCLPHSFCGFFLCVFNKLSRWFYCPGRSWKCGRRVRMPPGSGYTSCRMGWGSEYHFRVRNPFLCLGVWGEALLCRWCLI